MTTQTNTASANRARTLLILALALAAFFGAYRYASARNAPNLSDAGYTTAGTVTDGSASAAGGCCGGSGAPVEGTAALEGDVQKISVEIPGGYSPNVINLKAGVPTEITFGQSSGCTAQVVSQELGFAEDLTQGPRTVKLDGLQPGTYSFSCGMQMVFGSIVVK